MGRAQGQASATEIFAFCPAFAIRNSTRGIKMLHFNAGIYRVVSIGITDDR